MLPAALALAVWLPAVVGFGSFWRVDGGPLRRAGIAGVSGLAVLATFAVALHLVAPLSPPVAIVALVAGWILFIRARQKVLAGVRAHEAVFAASLIVVLAALTQLPARHYDSGLYFLQSVLWAQEHAQVPGLASLHPRLGYNSSWFALAAIVEIPGLVGRSSFFLNSLPVILASLVAADAVGRLRVGDRRASTFYFALAPFAAIYGAETLGSLCPDQPAAILTVLSLGFLVHALEDPEGFSDAAFIGALLAGFALTVKVSAIVLAGAWAAFLVVRRRSLDGRVRVLVIAAAAALFLPWLARGLVTSGCVLFPAAWSCFPSLSWSTPPAIVTQIDVYIRAWARWPGVPAHQALRDWAWFPGWLRSALGLPHVSVPVVGAVFGVLAMRARLLRPSAVRLPLLVVAAGLAFWFFTAPSPRFGIAYLLSAAMLVLSAWAAEDAPGLRPSARRLTVLIVAVAALMYLHWSVRPLRKLRADTFALARWPEFPTVGVDRRVTSPGTEVKIPITTDQCWATAPPCTPWYAPGLVWTGRAFQIGGAERLAR
jgi:hypothetical protein